MLVDGSQMTVEHFQALIESFGLLGPLVYMFIFIVAPYALIPAVLLAVAAGMIWGLKGFVYLQIAANLAAVLEFLVARHWARDYITKRIKWNTHKFDRALEKHGFIAVLLIRLIPNVIWNVQNLGLGLTKVKFRDYFWGTFFGIMPYSFAVVYFGSSSWDVWQDPNNLWKFALSIGILILIFGLQKLFRSKKEGLATHD